MTDLPISLRRSVLVLGAVLVLTQASGCNDTYVGGGNPSTPISRFIEIEPNDDPISADFVAVLDDRSTLAVIGTVEAIGFDIVDHIEFETSMPLELDFSLLAVSPGGDVDVTIYDPIANAILGTYATGGDEEFGTIIVHEPGRPFQFVIEAYGVASDWDLELYAYPYDCGCAPATIDTGSMNETDGGALEVPTTSNDSESEAQGSHPWIELRGALDKDETTTP